MTIENRWRLLVLRLLWYLVSYKQEHVQNKDSVYKCDNHTKLFWQLKKVFKQLEKEMENKG